MRLHRVFLLRHGFTQLNLDKITMPSDGGVPLCQIGRDAALANVDDTLDQIKLMNPTGEFAILYSPAARTTETMKMYEKHATLIEEMPQLIEVNFGDYALKPEKYAIDGVTMSDLRIQLTEGNTEYRYPNGESHEEITARAKAVISRFNDIRKIMPVLVIGHNRIFRHIELEYRAQIHGEHYYAGMFGSSFPHASVYDIDAAFAEF